MQYTVFYKEIEKSVAIWGMQRPRFDNKFYGIRTEPPTEPMQAQNYTGGWTPRELPGMPGVGGVSNTTVLQWGCERT